MLPELAGELKPGDSITVDGACQTAVRNDKRILRHRDHRHHPIPDDRGRLSGGSRVNLERSMVLGGRLDGHLVQGHVDGVGQGVGGPQGGRLLAHGFLSFPDVVAGVTILHGSIAINGVSLTVNALPSERPMPGGDHPVHLGAHESWIA